eukprot:4958402-Pleurochrysis_carterae.AAC.1
MEAKSHQRFQAASSFRKVLGAAALSVAAARAALSRWMWAGAAREVMLETVRSWAALAAAVRRAASRLGVATPPGRQQGERGR